MSKKVVRVGLETTAFGFPFLRSYQQCYRSDNGTEAFEIVYTVYTVQLYSLYIGIHTVIEMLDYTFLFWRNAFIIIVGLIAYHFGEPSTDGYPQ